MATTSSKLRTAAEIVAARDAAYMRTLTAAEVDTLVAIQAEVEAHAEATVLSSALNMTQVNALRALGFRVYAKIFENGAYPLDYWVVTLLPYPERVVVSCE